MSVPDVKGQFYPTKEEAKTVYLRSLASAAERAGITINVLPGSLNDFKAEAIASIVAPAYANNKLARQSLSPLEATDDQIVDVAAAYGVFPRAASPSAGFVTVSLTSATATQTIPAGFKATLGDGTKIQTVSIVTVSTGDNVEVIASTGGASTNQSAGAQVTWDSGALAYLKRTAVVAAGGLTLGRDEDTPAIVRQRLLERLASPGTGGNWAYVAALAEKASASVSKAFVYPAIGGPGSYGVALVSDDTDRGVASSVVNAVGGAIVAEMPGHAYLNVTACTAQQLDVIFELDIPRPTFAGGTGGGWRDASPWPPKSDGGGTYIYKVTSYAGNQITTDAIALGSCATGTHIGIWDPVDEIMYEFEVLTATLAGTVKITVVGGFPKDFTGCYISAGAENLKDYAASALAAFKALGPGEKTSSTAILPRGLRKPLPTSTEWPQGITSRFTETILGAHDEISNIEVLRSYDTGTTTDRYAPSVPTSFLDPPNILTPKYMAFKPNS